jgi:hypothetical protein
MEDGVMDWVVFLIPVVGIIAVFTFVAVAAWSDNRRKEREAYYRHETLRKLADTGGDSAESVLEVMRQEERARERRKLEGLKLGGLITAAVGAGVMVFLYYLAPEEEVYLAGLIPLLIGVVMLIYVFFMAPSPDESLPIPRDKTPPRDSA